MVVRIVIVEDNFELRRFLARFIALLGARYQVVGQAGSVREAILRIEEETPDIVLLDVELPGANGVQVTRCIRRRFPHTTVVAFGCSLPGCYQQALLRAGALAYLDTLTMVKLLPDVLRVADLPLTSPDDSMREAELSDLSKLANRAEPLTQVAIRR